ncbi:peptide deformylase [Arthrobacter wenxiniae]|jgi:peptide deformylase|uniref:Peptide deformylase n=1 Tax=Arthrobacter wenxiniae TaxID=2713570 RepID=A0A7Y7LY62_9MICC|nr:peptide deformylase [Arthrobacter wenxiniae]NVM95125.1 peptide deformylase [Arthrobacter wenxiniae]
MAILSIRLIGDPVLRTPASDVTEFGPELAKLVEDMAETMADVSGAGLAAPQVGISRRIFTYAVDGHEGHVINPVIAASDDFAPDEPEGCLSVPGLGFRVRRHRWVRLTGVDMNGQPLDMEATGMLAKCFQHETDHLDGKLYVDRLEGEDRKAALRSIRTANYHNVTAQTLTKRARTVGSAFGAGAAG